jgi:hypothetical protein
VEGGKISVFSYQYDTSAGFLFYFIRMLRAKYAWISCHIVEKHLCGVSELNWTAYLQVPSFNRYLIPGCHGPGKSFLNIDHSWIQWQLSVKLLFWICIYLFTRPLHVWTYIFAVCALVLGLSSSLSPFELVFSCCDLPLNWTHVHQMFHFQQIVHNISIIQLLLSAARRCNTYYWSRWEIAQLFERNYRIW